MTIMTTVRKTSNVVSLGKAGGSKSVSPAKSSTTASPFAIKPPDPLKSLTDRKSSLSELQKLAILQRALEPYAQDARSHLPPHLQTIDKKVRTKMIKDGFSKEVATEAGDEIVTAILGKQKD